MSDTCTQDVTDAGDVFTLATAETRDDYEDFRWHLACPENFETVELDDDGRVKP